MTKNNNNNNNNNSNNSKYNDNSDSEKPNCFYCFLGGKMSLADREATHLYLFNDVTQIYFCM